VSAHLLAKAALHLRLKSLAELPEEDDGVDSKPRDGAPPPPR
jgi:hypothetical protein